MPESDFNPGGEYVLYREGRFCIAFSTREDAERYQLENQRGEAYKGGVVDTAENARRVGQEMLRILDERENRGRITIDDLWEKRETMSGIAEDEKVLASV